MLGQSQYQGIWWVLWQRKSEACREQQLQTNVLAPDGSTHDVRVP